MARIKEKLILSVPVTPALDEAIRAAATREGLSIGRFIREAVEVKLRYEEARP